MTIPSFVIRPVRAADVPVIVRHRRAMFQEMGVGDEAGLDAMAAEFAQWVVDKLDDGDYLGWFAMCGNEVAAGVGLWIMEWPPHPLDATGRRGYILNVYTEPGHRLHGLARRLVSIALEWCRESDIVTVSLHASGDGRLLYESLDFKQTNEMRLVLRSDPLDISDVVVYGQR